MHFELVSDEAQFVEINVFAVKEDVVFDDTTLKNIFVEISHSGQNEGFPLLFLIKQKKANISEVHNFGTSVTDGTLGNLDITGLDEPNLADLDKQTRMDLLLNASR